jgi:acyl-CoA synthetase (NDP forming)
LASELVTGSAPASENFALSRLWSARSVAVVGASDRPGALGRLPIEHLLRYGYRGAIYPVRPDGASVAGLPSYQSVQACPGTPELAMIMVSASRVEAAVDDCIAAGVPTAIVCSSGFAETGPEGAALQGALAEKARAAGLRLVGPNTIGSVGVDLGLVASFSPLFSGERTELVPGGIGFVSQSGALGYGAVSLAFERGLGLGWVVNTGNEADVRALEVMTAMARMPDCEGVLGYLEVLDDVGGLRTLASSGVPVALVKAGRSTAGQRAAASHTGALATEDRVVDAALRQFGIVRADDVDDLLDMGDAFAQPRRPAGPRVAVVTTSGGSGILAADAIEAARLTLAGLGAPTIAALAEIVPAFGATANPVDVTATVMSDPTLFDRALDVIVDDDGVDAVVACFCVLTAGDVDRVVESLARVAERSGKPVLAARTGAAHLAPAAAAAMRAAGIPSYPTPARAVRALAGLWQVSRPHMVDVESDESVVPARRPPVEASEIELKSILRAAGLPVPGGRLARDASDTSRAVAEVGGSAVLKAVVPGLLHKSDVGGVEVGVTVAGAGIAYERVRALGGEVLVEEMVSGGLEVLVGMSPTPLGQVLTVGVGGVLTEAVDDVALRVLPVGRREVEAMIDETRLGRLLAGTRGSTPYDRTALVSAVLDLVGATAEWPSGFELDLNPVTVLPAGQGVRILDAAYVAPKED